jgi:hypothetical protein
MQGGNASTYLPAETFKSLDDYCGRNNIKRSKFIKISVEQCLKFALEREEATKQKEATHDTDPIYK